ncbi:hypothetical protein PBI_MIAZEAL_214 [Mycobacterium phage MiaZeal]|uniref:hypothetical protein n=1 Tax=Mycobacterium phage MiaZeal TaxID=1567005 RepID=UPI000540D33B|nr:hypothetical protein AVV70_gp225 [Mycobacterium phage MiaZeal]AIY32566.1 hypothetical protein PBI_MIAZEAL_214 [Mycobacterium phage MiaZeal]
MSDSFEQGAAAARYADSYKLDLAARELVAALEMLPVDAPTNVIRKKVTRALDYINTVRGQA